MASYPALIVPAQMCMLVSIGTIENHEHELPQLFPHSLLVVVADKLFELCISAATGLSFWPVPCCQLGTRSKCLYDPGTIEHESAGIGHGVLG